MNIFKKYSDFILATYVVARIYAFLKYGFLFEDKKWKVGDAGEMGEGLFTTRDRKKGSVVFVSTGKTRYWKATTEEDAEDNPNWYCVRENVWVDMQLPYVKVNHSCTPNLGIDGTRTFVALRDIKVGEQLFFDYSITDAEEHWVMPCVRVSEHCESEIGGIQTMSKERYARSYPYIPKYMQTVYEKHQKERQNT